MNNIIIKSIESNIEVKQLLIEFNEAFTPPLNERILDFESYAQKLIDNGYIYIAINEIAIVGFVAFYANDITTNIGYLTQIAVKQDSDIKGVGYELIKHFERLSLEKGMRTLKLEVSIYNTHAINFYLRNGYEHYDKATESTIYMIKKSL